MRKRRRNIIIINNEIDYDKLVETIVRANEEIEYKKQKSSKILTSAIAVLLSISFIALGIVFGFFTVTTIYAYTQLFSTINQMNIKSGEIIAIHALICLLIFAMIVAVVIMVVSAVEIHREKDRNFIMGAFSGVVGFAALIIAVIALFKGVA